MYIHPATGSVTI